MKPVVKVEKTVDTHIIKTFGTRRKTYTSYLLEFPENDPLAHFRIHTFGSKSCFLNINIHKKGTWKNWSMVKNALIEIGYAIEVNPKVIRTSQTFR